MSLDVYLKIKDVTIPHAGSGIFIREGGQTKEITREEWNKRYPDREPVTFNPTSESEYVFKYNITHNLGKMAGKAGIYYALWRPEELGITKASQLIDYLQPGLKALRNYPEKFKKFNPENGWGDYEGLVKFVEEYLKACEEYPEAEVLADR